MSNNLNFISKEEKIIADYLKSWQKIPEDFSLLDKILTDELNKIITDHKINQFINEFPQYKKFIENEILKYFEHLMLNSFYVKLKNRTNEIKQLEKIRLENQRDLDKLNKLLVKDLNKTNISYIKKLNFLKQILKEKENIKNELANLVKEVNNLNNPQKIKLQQKILDLDEKLKNLNNLLNKEKQEIINNATQLSEAIEEIDNFRKNFLRELYQKIDKLQEILSVMSPIINEFIEPGYLWDMSTGIWHKTALEILKYQEEILEKKENLRKLADLLGKYLEIEKEKEWEKITETIPQLKFSYTNYGKSEIVGITESNDLNNLLPSELALLSDADTESIFFKKFAEKKLQTFLFITEEKTDKESEKSKKKQKGPFILAIDTSGSMHGAPEQVAKLVAFAITKVGLKEKRKVYLISFSTQIQTIELTDIQNSLMKLIDFLTMSFHGGTDVAPALSEAVKQMKSKSYENADLLIISDGIFGNINFNSWSYNPERNKYDNLLNDINELQKKGNNFYALIIGNSYNKEALEFCNKVWTYNLDKDELKIIWEIKEEFENIED